jgi:hypothetical protein
LPARSGTLTCALASGLDRGELALRHLHIDPQPPDIRDNEQFAAGGPTHVDQRADIGIARRDDAVERRHQARISLHCADPLNVRLQALHCRLSRRQVAGLLVGFLPRYRIFFQ